MLAAPGGWGFSFTKRNYTVPLGTVGTSVTPGASNAEGSWTEVLSASDVTHAIDWVQLRITSGIANSVGSWMLLDFGFDPAGGTSYQAFFSDLPCARPGSFPNEPRFYDFPCTIPKGSSIAVRLQSSVASPVSCRVLIDVFGGAQGILLPPTYGAETIGTVTNSRGVTIPGSSTGGAWNSWQSIGSLTHKARHYLLGVQALQNTTAGRTMSAQLAFGDGSTFELIEHLWMNLGASNVGYTNGHTPLVRAQRTLPAGASLYGRIYVTSGETIDCDMNVVAIR